MSAEDSRADCCAAVLADQSGGYTSPAVWLLLRLASTSIRAAERDSTDPSEKSAGRSPEGVAVIDGNFADFSMSSALLTTIACCAHGGFKPGRKGSILCIRFQFLCGHPLKQFVKVEMFAAVDPLTGCVDLGISLDSRNYRRCRHVDLTCALDDFLQSCPDVAFTLRKQACGVGMPVDC